MSKLTKQNAKDLTIGVWQYLVDHPKICLKHDLPREILETVAGCACYCPLCTLFGASGCIVCPLGSCDEGSSYHRWYNAETEEERKMYAQEVLDAVKSWEI